MSQETTVDVADQNNATQNTSDNLSQSDLEAQLINHMMEQGNPTHPPAEPPEDPEDPDPELDPEDPDPEDPAIDPEDPEEIEDPEDDPDDVLSQYDINWDDIPPEHAKEMNRRLGGNFHKRFDQQTAIIKQLESKLKTAREEQSTDASTGELADIQSLEDLQSLERDLTKRSREINKILRRSEKVNDDGDEYLYEEDGKFYTRDDVENWLDATEGQLEKVPDRKQHVAELEKKREASDKLAGQVFPELDNPDSVYSERYESMKSDPEYAPLFKMANAKYLAGMLLLAEKVIQGAQKPPAKKPTKKRPKSPVPSQGIAPARQTHTAKTQKAIAQAQARFNETGSMADLQALEELKLKLN